MADEPLPDDSLPVEPLAGQPLPDEPLPSALTDEPSLPPGPSFGLTFLYYFSGTALVTTLLAVKTLGLGLDTGIPNQYGLWVGALGGVLGALGNRSSTLTVPISSRKTFKRQLDAALTEMGYAEDANASFDGVLVYRRPALRQLFSGRVYVLIGEKQAQIRSRAVHLSGIKKRLTASGIRTTT